MRIDADSVELAADLVADYRPTVVFTGAGVSVESGIPDFRSAGGLWERFDPMEYATIEAFRANPHKVWRMLRELERTLDGAKPNPGHRALAELEEMGVALAVITQNIDNLHQEAGSREVVEFHGNGRRLVCLRCGAVVGHEEAERHLDAEGAPICASCETVLKPDVVLFGEAIPEAAMQRAFELSACCGTMIVAGTSATVLPAAALPMMARQGGAKLVEVNLEPTGLTAEADVALLGPSGVTLPALVDAVAARLGT